MRNYELTVIFDPGIKKEDEEKLILRINKIIEDGKGKIKKVEEWGKRKFSYKIKKLDEGIYFLFFFESAAENIFEIDKKIKLEEKILRYLLIVDEGR